MRLKITNNWEDLYWEIDKTDVTAALSRITLQMPDESVQDFKVTWKLESKEYYDMGIPRYVNQYKAYIKLDAYGIKLDTCLEDVTKKRKVKIIDYKVRRPK